MSENNQAMGGYGYQDDDVNPSGSGLKFGLNQGKLTLSAFQWIPNAGKDGAEQEALDIQFMMEGREKPISYRKFPITKAFDKSNNNAEVTDPSHPEIIKAKTELSQVLTHIVGCFVDKETLKNATSLPVASFKDYCKVLESLLPANYNTIPLDAFFQYQWNINGERDRTYLELPKNMKQGRFLNRGTTNDWVEKKTNTSLKYVDANDEKTVHPFQRGEWFLNSNFAKQQKEGGDDSTDTSNVNHNTSTTGTSPW